MMRARLICMCLLLLVVSGTGPQEVTKSAEEVAKERRAIEDRLESIAIIDRKVRIPMRDGTLIAADVYRPKGLSKKYPIIFVWTPHNFNYWDVQLGAPSDMSEAVQAIEHGYAYVLMNEPGISFKCSTPVENLVGAQTMRPSHVCTARPQLLG